MSEIKHTSECEQNIAQLRQLLARYKESGIGHVIAGQKRNSISNATFINTSPIDGSAICTIAKGDAQDIDAAAQAAQDAFPAWRDMAATKRKQILHDIADAITERAEEIALLESWDTGQALRFMSKAAIRGAENFRFFADRVPQARDGESLHSPHHLNYTSRSPLGPVGVITPWNTPFMLSTWKIAPALAAGCTVVHKPAELSPVTAHLLLEIAESAGLPKGVWNIVNGFGEDAGKALTEHPMIKAIAFVGESATGSAIMAQAAPTLKRVHFELGGKNPVIVFDDADLERALDAVVFMIYSLNGERCTSSSRVLLHSSIYESFTNQIKERVAKIKIGHPLDPATEIGPLISDGHMKKVLSYFEIAKQDGATIAIGGAPAEQSDYAGAPGGHFVKPTLFTNAKNDMRIAQEEIFGPVLTAIPFESDEDALAIANDVRYGLAGYLWTNDLSRALKISDGLEAGMIWVNSENVRHLPTPFGGVKESGIGRDGGDFSFEFYMERKNVALAYGSHGIPKLGK